jgi:hypothetical protein
MLHRKLTSKSIRLACLGFAGVGVFHFSFSVLIWCWALIVALKTGHVTWSEFFYHATSAFVLLAAFISAFVLAWRFRALAAPLTVVSILAAVLCFSYDTRHHHYQLQTMEIGKGCTHGYFTWWLYDDSRDPNR